MAFKTSKQFIRKKFIIPSKTVNAGSEIEIVSKSETYVPGYDIYGYAYYGFGNGSGRAIITFIRFNDLNHFEAYNTSSSSINVQGELYVLYSKN